MRQATSQRDSYINKTFAHEDSYLLEIRKALSHGGKAGIHIDPYEGQLLSLLLQLIGTQTVIEIGTLYGYSTLWMAKALPEQGKIISIEKSQENHKQAQMLLRHTPQWKQIELKCGEAVHILKELNGTYDAAFIDADKAGYMDYLSWADAHIRPGGLIIGDNTLLFGHLIGEGQGDISSKQLETMKKFNEHLSNSQKYDSVMIPTPEGLTVALKK